MRSSVSLGTCRECRTTFGIGSLGIACFSMMKHSSLVREADQIATQVEEQVKKEFDEVTEIKVRIEPPKPRPTDENSAHSFDY